MKPNELTLETKSLPYRERAKLPGGSRGRPDMRERLASSGPSSLSDAELVAALLGMGIQGKSVQTLSEEVLACIDRNYSRGDRREARSPDWLSGIRGLGPAKSGTIEASLELGRRLFGDRKRRIALPEDAWSAVAHYADRMQEQFVSLSLNGAHEILGVRVVSVGLVNRTMVHPREVFADALMDRACAIIVAHNHPSGNLEPSPEDLEITERLRESGKTLGIALLDHIIFSRDGFLSLAERGHCE